MACIKNHILTVTSSMLTPLQMTNEFLTLYKTSFKKLSIIGPGLKEFLRLGESGPMWLSERLKLVKRS